MHYAYHPCDDAVLSLHELAASLPYLGHVAGVYSHWTPLAGRSWLFDEDIDRDDPWQFKNFRVA